MLLKSARICDASSDFCGDIWLENGVIKRVGDEICADEIQADGAGAESAENGAEFEVLDCSGKIVCPQFIDLNVLPKNRALNRKNLLSLVEKAKNGGVGGFVLRGDTAPRIDSEMAVEFIKSLDSGANLIFPSIAATNGEGKICDISILHALGGAAIALSSAQEANVIDKTAQYAKMLDLPLFITADDGLGGVVNRGAMAANLGLSAKNPLSEIKEVAKMLEVAVFYGISAVFSCVTEPRSLELIDEAKKYNENIYCETSIHHLLLDESACAGYNTAAKINPPLKDKATQEILLDALKCGRIDLLTSLQSASSVSLKEQVFSEASFGIDAISHYFSLLFGRLMQKGVNLSRICAVCAANPAKILRLNCGAIRPGLEARLMIIDPQKSVTIEDSPYGGLVCSGVVEGFI